MLDVYTDVTQLADVFGSHFELLEMDLLRRLRDAGDRGRGRARSSRSSEASSACPPSATPRRARRGRPRTSCALDRLVDGQTARRPGLLLRRLAGNEHEDIVTSVIAGNTLLTAHHVPVAGECEVKNVLAMKIMDCFGAGGSFSEFYLIDFDDDVVLWATTAPPTPPSPRATWGWCRCRSTTASPARGSPSR